MIKTSLVLNKKTLKPVMLFKLSVLVNRFDNNGTIKSGGQQWGDRWGWYCEMYSYAINVAADTI